MIIIGESQIREHVGVAWDWDQHICSLTVESLLTLSLLTCADSVDMLLVLW